MHSFRFILFFLCIGIFAHAQQNAETVGLLQKAGELASNNPQQAIKIGEHLLINAQKSNEKAAANFLIAESYLSMGNYKDALSFGFQAKSSGNSELQLKSDLLISGILRQLKLGRQADIYLAEAEELASKTSGDLQHFANGKIFYEKALAQIAAQNPKQALEIFQKSQSEFNQIKNTDGKSFGYKAIAGIGKAYSAMANYPKAAEYLNHALGFSRKNPKNLILETQVLCEISKMDFQQKQHHKAIDCLFTALKPAENLQHTFFLMEINKQLALNYLALNDRQNYSLYNQKFIDFSDTGEMLENEATNTAFNLISKEQENNTVAEEQKYVQFLYVAAGIFLAILTIGTLLFFKNKSKKTRYEEIAAYLENSKKVEEPVKITTPKNLIIPVETEQQLLLKLKKFEASTKFTNKEMSLAMLSAQMDTNTKYLSEIINRHRNDNFNTYINKLRIAYIIDKMKSDAAYLNYKISYLATESGFSSHSSFATIFKSITGIAPTTFIDFLKEESKSKKDMQNAG
ncbi:helix-turn-helix domain-containing protein [Flavobacterium noncentrifugens]|uniref:Helix-turn-helix domain-containing protein n=1 Tax=Flavobacterium noncentrifugens TaxID=1128970 RepID=A0A1G8RFV4_9FLAO|nr:helix-turn-helix domain-containing protein [Flavobacterium noncentrifugens]SDJ15887.1 Helix-turn-helix domain-containing protein [Flavobacterium noncentrifugens]